ncbi:MAG: hypothetical protein HF976_07765 [ANME-2 cluster archaeon]|nr:hypothetical protein [ANME-2 cluster archaeon]MBC2701295.1 hypothetical protein [ANME-2 cluster archaeon]MBC2708595.1 hypothetical protein [ANME-2 cluster archaeon]MBC2745500.1 hypothetical protein [ANME-2 cluster archaeon]MBC2762768.1 hypothetical protein [ANME-2 cluster archaeon]
MDSIRVQSSKLYDRDLKFAILRRTHPPAAPRLTESRTCSTHLEAWQPQYPAGTPTRQVCQYLEIPEGQPRVSAYSQAEGSTS